jgi:pimeloyl-ACP methyl ester carboxylesterase
MGELKYFGRQYHVAGLDFWGTGHSDRIPVWPDDWWEQAAHDSAALIEHLGYSQAILMGTSGGALVALLDAILHPNRVRAVIADSAVECFPAPVLSREVQGRFPATEEQARFWRWAQGDDWEQVVKADSNFLLRFEQAGGNCFQGRLKEIQCPILLTGSLADTSLPDVEVQLHGMADQIRTSRLYLASSGSHPLMWSRVDEFRREADKFLVGFHPIPGA